MKELDWSALVGGSQPADVNSIDWGNLFASTMHSFWTFVPDMAQIFILYLVFYSILKAARGSRFGQVLMGAGVLVTALAFFTLLFHFDVLQKILSGLLLYLALSTVVIFQQEIRRFLETLGALMKEDSSTYRLYAQERLTPEAFVDSVFHLADKRLGALMAFERGISLRGYERSGVLLDARISTGLLVSVFTPPLPLHDGGAIIRNGRLSAAHCLFPVSNNPVGLSESGMRHRAAVGISEETDALVVVVSEERGQVSVALNGQLKRYPDLSEKTREDLLRIIRTVVLPQKTRVEVLVAWLKEHGGSVKWLQKPVKTTSEEAHQ
ncbi:MAG: diadenylate cyclase [bacterium]|nr:diadenylate cyclase [bacterium]